MSETSAAPQKKRDGIYILIILLLIALAAVLGFLIANHKKAIASCQEESNALSNELATINEMFSGYVGEAEGDIKNELRGMLRLYDEALLKNDSNKDSIQMQKDKINTLLQELQSQKKRSASEIYALKKETETLRGIMKDYVRQIDSLFTANTGLKSNLMEKEEQLTTVTTERNELQNKTSELQGKVQTGSKLSAYSIKTDGLKYKTIGSGLKEHTKAGKIDKIRSCFTISENTLTSSGNKFVYLQIISPQGSVLSANKSNVVAINGVNTIYTERKQIDYQNESVDLCIYYDVAEDDLSKGNYVVKIFVDGAQIGSDSFTLR